MTIECYKSCCRARSNCWMSYLIDKGVLKRTIGGDCTLNPMETWIINGLGLDCARRLSSVVADMAKDVVPADVEDCFES